MSMYRLKLCGSTTEFNGIQAYLKDDSRYLALGMIGEAVSCETFNFAAESYIRKI